MTSGPAVSIIVPCYNVEAVLPRAVASVLGQTFTDWELILVNDCSTDATAAAARELAERDPQNRIMVVDLEVNSGSSGARNAGLDRARGEFVSFLDADDELMPEYLAELTAAMVPGIDVVICGHYMLSSSGSTTERASTRLGRLDGDDAVRAAMTGGLTPFPWDKLCRRSLFSGLRYPVGAKRFEDMTTNVALYARSRAVLALEKPLYRYHVSSTSLTWGRIPETSDMETALKHLEANLDAKYLTGAFAAPYDCMRTLMTLLVAQSAILALDRNPAAAPVLRQCRSALALRPIARTLRVAPVLGVGAAALKIAPRLYSALYRRYASASYGMDS